MSRDRALSRALAKADSRERKHKKRMVVSGTSVFVLRKLMRKRG